MKIYPVNFHFFFNFFYQIIFYAHYQIIIFAMPTVLNLIFMPTINDLYQLKKDDTPLTLHTLIVQAAFSESTVYIDGVKQEPVHQDSFTLDLGPNRNTAGKVLEIKSYVGKIPGQSQRTSVIITLDGGVEKKHFPNHDSSRDNPVIFHATIYFSF